MSDDSFGQRVISALGDCLHQLANEILCRDCNAPIGARRKGSPGRQQVFCLACKAKKKKEREKKHAEGMKVIAKGFGVPKQGMKKR